MALQDNQVIDRFQKELGRAPTAYEISKYSNSSIQDLANLKDIYGKQDPTSLVGYLGSTGQDFSLQNMANLAKQYGIVGFGTPEGNDALLKALKGGAPTTTPVGGSIVPPETPIAGSDNGSTAGSVAAAANSVDNSNQPPVVAGIDGALQSYQSIQKQIGDIDNSLATMLNDKKAEISRSGGIVNESQLKSEILSEQAPLLAHRRELAQNQAQAGKMYTDLLARQKESDQNFFKTQAADLAAKKQGVQESQFAEKQTLAEDKQAAAQTLADQKLEQAGWKMSKVNITDEAGNVLGQRVVWSQNPATVEGDNSFQNIPTTAGSGAIKGGVTNTGNTATLPKLTITDGASPEKVLQSLISGKPIVVKGDTTPISQQTLFNAALDDMLGVPNTLATGMGGSAKKTVISEKKSEIMAAFGLNEPDVVAIKAQMKGMTSANTALLKTAAFMHVYAGTSKDYLQLAQDQSINVPRGGAKMINKFTQWMQGQYTPAGDLAQFELYIYAAAREYAKVTTGGVASVAELSATAQKRVDELISASQSPEVFAKVAEGMKNDMDKQVGNFDKQTNSFPEAVKQLYGMISGASVSPKTSSTTPTLLEPSKIPSGYYQASDGLLYKK